MSDLSAIVKDIAALAQAKSFKEALDLCKVHAGSKQVLGSFLFWSSAAQCAVQCMEWKLAENYLTTALKCDVPPAQLQKMYKVLLKLLPHLRLQCNM